MSSWKDDGQIWDRSSGQRGELHFDKRCCSLQNLCETQRSWCALRMFVWSLFLRLYKTCMIAPCVVVSTIRISRFQMQTGFDWSFPSIHQEIRIFLVFRSGLVTFLLKCGEYCGGRQVHPFLLKCCGDCGWAAVTFVSQACTKDCHQKQTAFGIGVGFGEACTWVYHVQAFGYWLTLESV